MSAYPEVRLGDVLAESSDTVPASDDHVFEMVGVRSFGRGLFGKPAITGSDSSYARFTRIAAGQFVYSRLFAWEGALAVVPKEYDGRFVSPEFPVFEVDGSRIDQSYLLHLCEWPGLHARLRGQTSGVGNRRQRVNVNRLLAVKVPLPNLGEQQRVAALLDQSLTLDGRIRQADLMRAATEKSAIRTAFSRADADARLGDLVELEREPLVEIDPDAPYIQIGIRSFGKGIFHKPTNGAGLSKIDYFHVYPDRLIFSNIMAWEGAVAVSGLSETGCVGSRRFLSYKAMSVDANLAYLNYFFRSEAGAELLRGGSTGTVKRNQTLAPSTIESFRVPCPSGDTQANVVSILDRFTGELNALGARRTSLASALRVSFLNTAFSGKL